MSRCSNTINKQRVMPPGGPVPEDLQQQDGAKLSCWWSSKSLRQWFLKGRTIKKKKSTRSWPVALLFRLNHISRWCFLLKKRHLDLWDVKKPSSEHMGTSNFGSRRSHGWRKEAGEEDGAFGRAQSSRGLKAEAGESTISFFLINNFLKYTQE